MADTLEQLLAQSLDRNLAITANAGSGKTRVLVQRYVNILMNDPRFVDPKRSYMEEYCSPRHIVAITFTRKAASEMLAKIVEKIEDKYQHASTRNELEKLKKIREELTSARISTIHSFCSSLLREYPIEADVSPNFMEMSESELLTLEKNCIIAIMEDWLEDSESDRRAKAQILFRLLGRRNIEFYIKVLLSKPDLFPALQVFYSRSDEEIIKERNQLLSSLYLAPLADAITELYSIAGRMDGKKLGPATSRNLAEAQALLSSIINQPDAFNYDDFEQVGALISDLNEVRKLLYTKDGFKKLFAKGFQSDDDLSRANSLAACFSKIEDLDDVLEFEKKDFDLIALVRILLDMADEARASFEIEKSTAGGLDFEDMLLKTMELLNNERVRRQVRKKIRYLLVDEFQDTNHVQYEIVKRLVPELEMPDSDDDSINVFIVGDAKQSIYGFRNADVRVFEQARKDLRQLNSIKFNKKTISQTFNTPDGYRDVLIEKEKLGDLSLTATFRLQPVPASFVNKVCGAVMSQRETDYDVEYENLVCARSVTDLEKSDTPADCPLPGSVSFLLTETKKKKGNDIDEADEDSEEELSEAHLLARYIRNLIDNPQDTLICDRAGNRKKPRFGDIAVLTRKRKGFNELVQAFLEYRIPYTVHSGTGFYDTQEIIDIISCLNFLHNQNDNLALAALLKSPFLGVTDTELYLISLEKNCLTLWEKLNHFCRKINSHDPDNMLSGLYPNTSRACEILSSLITIAPGMQVSHLIIYILDKCGWYGTLAGSPGRWQVEANIEKLLDNARDFESKGFRSLYDYVEELNFISESSVSESEAVRLTGEDAVNIMTIHASKGLEFPIVCLFRTNESVNRQNSGLFVSRELGVSFPLPAVIDGVFHSSVTTPLQMLASARQSLIEKAEEKRILYVAMTRAMDHLVISASFREGSSGSGMIGMICNGLGLPLASLYESDEIALTDTLPVLTASGEVKNYNIAYKARVIKNIESAVAAQNGLSMSDELPPLLLYDFSPVIDNDMFSATRLTAFDAGFDSYIQKYLLGLPEDDDIEAQARILTDKDDEGLTGTQPGILIHSVLEDISLWLNSDGSINNEELEKVIDSVIENQAKEVSPELRQRVHKECAAVASTKLIKLIAPNIDKALPEYELYLPVDNNFITAKIDVLILNSSGLYEIWDWKTNLVPTEEIINRHVAHYELQMKIYAYFLSLMYKNQDKFIARLLFTRLAKPNAADSAWSRKYEWSRKEIEDFGIELHKKINEAQKKTYRLIF